MTNLTLLFSLDDGDIAEYDALYDLYDDYRKTDFGGRLCYIRITVIQFPAWLNPIQRDYFDGDIAGGISQLFELENYDSSEY